MTVKTFRILMLSFLVSTGASFVVSVLFPELLPRQLQIAYQEVFDTTTPFYGNASMSIVSSVALVVASISAYLGLFFFKKWARPLSLALTGSIFFIWLVLGSNVSSGLAQAFSDLSMVLWGAILAAAYLPPINSHFS